jgi:hypothetical protein
MIKNCINIPFVHIVRTSSRGRGSTKSIRKRTPMGWELQINVRTYYLRGKYGNKQTNLYAYQSVRVLRAQAQTKSIIVFLEG